MKRVAFIVLVVALFHSAPAYSEDLSAITNDGTNVILHSDGTWTAAEESNRSGDFDFRKIYWGMNKNNVMASEPFTWNEGELDPNTVYLYTTVDLLGDEFLLIYYLNLDRVYRIRYSITEKHSNRTDYWRFYTRLVSALKEKYGEPSADYDGAPFWKDDLYKDQPSDWGMALAVGDMFALAIWPTERSEITALIQGDNYDIDLFLEFEANDFDYVEAEATPAF